MTNQTVMAFHASSLFLPMSLHLWSLAVTQTSLLFARQYMANAAHHQEDSDLASSDVVQPTICGVPIVCDVALICILG